MIYFYPLDEIKWMCYNIIKSKIGRKRGKIVQENKKRKSIWNIVQIVIIGVLCAFVLITDFVKISYVQDGLKNAMISKTVQQTCGLIAAVLIMLRLDIRLFGKPQQLLYLIPCVIIAADNFQFSSYFNGNMNFATNDPLDFVLFGLYCLSVGLFEECIFRGILFSILASQFSKDRKGFILTYVVSSLIFGAAHLLNGVSLGALWQVGYTVLTGGLFAFCLIKTKNILCCGVIHGLYNFGGLLFTRFDAATGAIGLGTGVVFDTGTVITMLVVSIVVGAFVLYKVFTYTDAECACLYEKLGVKYPKNEQVGETTEENA